MLHINTHTSVRRDKKNMAAATSFASPDFIFSVPESLFDVYVESARVLFRAKMVDNGPSPTPNGARVASGTWCSASAPEPVSDMFRTCRTGWSCVKFKNEDPATVEFVGTLVDALPPGGDVVGYISAASMTIACLPPPRVAVVAADTVEQFEAGLRQLRDCRFFVRQRGVLIQRATLRVARDCDGQHRNNDIAAALRNTLPKSWTPPFFMKKDGNSLQWFVHRATSICEQIRSMRGAPYVLVEDVPTLATDNVLSAVKPEWMVTDAHQNFVAGASELTKRAIRVSLWQGVVLVAIGSLVGSSGTADVWTSAVPAAAAAFSLSV